MVRASPPLKRGVLPFPADDLEATVRATPCDLVIIGTPIDLRRLISFEKPTVRVTYELAERGRPNLEDVLAPIAPRA